MAHLHINLQISMLYAMGPTHRKQGINKTMTAWSALFCTIHGEHLTKALLNHYVSLDLVVIQLAFCTGSCCASGLFACCLFHTPATYRVFLMDAFAKTILCATTHTHTHTHIYTNRPLSGCTNAQSHRNIPRNAFVKPYKEIQIW